MTMNIRKEINELVSQALTFEKNNKTRAAENLAEAYDKYIP
jgi:hypothetical protein